MRSTLYNGYKVNLIESEQDIKEMLSRFNPKVKCGIDTETSSLDYTEVQLAGVCISGGASYSLSDYQGYYIPVGHIIQQNYPE